MSLPMLPGRVPAPAARLSRPEDQRGVGRRSNESLGEIGNVAGHIGPSRPARPARPAWACRRSRPLEAHGCARQRVARTPAGVRA
jgi:hypothetical protein